MNKILTEEFSPGLLNFTKDILYKFDIKSISKEEAYLVLDNLHKRSRNSKNGSNILYATDKLINELGRIIDFYE